MTRPVITRWLRRLTIVGFVLGMLTFTAGTIATASGMSTLDMPDVPTGRDCLDPKMPENPLSMPMTAIDPGPDNRVAGDPFQEGSQASLYDRYGYAGHVFSIFDVPNKMDICQPVTFDMDLRAANLWRQGGLTLTAVLVNGTRVVTSGELGSLWDPIQQAVMTTSGATLFVTLIGMATAVAATIVLWRRAHRGHLSAAAAWFGKATLIVVTAVACMFFTVGVGGAVDAGIRLGFQASSEAVTNVTGRSPADLVGATMMDYVWYPSWQDATFGQDEAPRREFSERLWKAGTFTVEEQQAINDDPGTANAKIDERREQYRTVMLELQEKYPQTYRRAAGMDTGGALGSTLPGLLTVLVTAWFLLVCLALMAYGSAIARVAVGLYPFIAIPAVFHWLHHLATRIGAMVLWAAWRGVVASFAFFVFLVSCVGWVLRGTMSPFVKVIAVALIGAALWAAMSRFNVIPQLRLRERFERRRGERDRRRNNNDGGYEQFNSPRRPDAPYAPFDAPHRPNPGGPGGAGGRVPIEATRSARPRDVDDLGHLKSARNPAQARHTAGEIAAVAASRAHPAIAAGVTTGKTVKGASDKTRQLTSAAQKALPAGNEPASARARPVTAGASTQPVGPPAPRRALPVSTTKPPAAVNAPPRSYHAAVTAGNHRPPAPPSTDVVQGTVVARGIHTPTAAPPPARRNEQ